MRLLEKHPNIDTSSSVTGAIIFYGINSLATTLSNSQFYPTLPTCQAPLIDCAASTFGSIGNTRGKDSWQATTADEYRNDPRNPNKNLKPTH
jgi:hypothetical protein